MIFQEQPHLRREEDLRVTHLEGGDFLE